MVNTDNLSECKIKESFKRMVDHLLYVKTSTKKRIKCIPIALVAALIVQLLSPFNVLASQNIIRLAGQNRYETAKEISEYSFGNKVKAIVLVSGSGFADAISADELAYKLNAPIILVGYQGITENEALDFVSNHLEATGKIYLIGGSGVFNSDFVTSLQNNGFSNIEEIGGSDKYQTNALLLDKYTIPKESPIFITSGEDLPDSMAISSVSSNKGWPIILISSDGISVSNRNYINKIKPSIVYIIGGYAVVPQSVEAELNSLVPESKIVRLAGQDRYGTLAQVFKTFNQSPTSLILATDSNLSDAFSGSSIAAKTGDPLILVDSSFKTPPNSIANYLDAHKKTGISITAIGGNVVVPDLLVSSMSNLLDGSVGLHDINSITNLDTVITVGDTFKFPETVNALLYDSSITQVPVTWSNTTLDTSKPGISSFHGSVNTFSEGVKLTVNVNKQKETYGNLKDMLTEELGSNINNVGIAFSDLSTGTSFSINGDTKFLAASTAKIARILVLYDLIREGKLDENQLVYYKEDEYLGGTGIMQYENLNEPFAFNTLAKNAIEYSDNIAIQVIGDNMCEQAEEQLRVRNLLGHDLYVDGNNILSANDALIMLQHLYTGANNGDTGYQKIVEWLKNTDFHDRLDRDLDHSIVAHKIGNLDDATNDIGIFYTGKPYVLTVYTSGLVNPNDVIANISNIVYDYQAAHGN